MALDANRTAIKVVDALAAKNSLIVGGTRTQMIQCWEIIIQEFFTEFKTNGQLVLEAADIKVDPGSFNIASAPVVGQGDNAPVTLTGKFN